MPKSKGKRPSSSKRDAPDPGFRLLGAPTGSSPKVPPDTGDPVRSAVLAAVYEGLDELPTELLAAMLPGIFRCSQNRIEVPPPPERAD